MYSVISKLVSRGVQQAVKQVTLTATQKTAANVASKVAIATATTAGSIAVNKFIQEKESTKLANEIETNLTAHEEDSEVALMTDEEVVKRAKKGQTKANVASGAVVGVGAAATTLVDIAFKAI